MARFRSNDPNLQAKADKLRTLEDEIQIKRTQYGGREFIREADGRWFDERRNELIVGEDRSVTIKKPDVEPYTRHSLARWNGQEIPHRRWFI